MRGEPGSHGEPGAPGQLPSIDEVMPWLHRLFDAWEDYRRQRAREALEAAEHEANTYAAMAEFGHDEVFEADEDNNDDERERRKNKKERKKGKKKEKRKHRKDKDRHKE